MSVAGLLVTAVTVDADHPQTADQFAQQELAKKVVGANLHKICLPDFIDHSGGPSLLGQHIAAILSNLLAKKAKNTWLGTGGPTTTSPLLVCVQGLYRTSKPTPFSGAPFLSTTDL
jgi:hypothetical protein